MSRVKKSENSWKLRIIAPPPRENKEMFLGKGGAIIRTIRVVDEFFFVKKPYF